MCGVYHSYWEGATTSGKRVKPFFLFIFFIYFLYLFHLFYSGFFYMGKNGAHIIGPIVFVISFIPFVG